MAPTHAYINFFSFRLNNLYTDIKSEKVIYWVLLMLKSKVLANETLLPVKPVAVALALNHVEVP